MRDNDIVSMTEACRILGIDKHNGFKLLKTCVLKDAGTHKVVGSAFQRYVTMESVEKYQQWQKHHSKEVETFKMRLDKELYIAVCKGVELDEEQKKELQNAFIEATNLTIQSRTYRALRKGIEVGIEGDFDDQFDDEEEKGEEEKPFEVDDLALEEDADPNEDDFEDDEEE